jgi:hypothetical protein
MMNQFYCPRGSGIYPKTEYGKHDAFRRLTCNYCWREKMPASVVLCGLTVENACAWAEATPGTVLPTALPIRAWICDRT